MGFLICMKTLVLILCWGSVYPQNLRNGIMSWKNFFTDFAVMKNRPIFVFASDENDREWTMWTENVLRYVVKKTNIEFSIIPLEKVIDRSDNTINRFHYNITSLESLRTLEKPFFLVAPFKTKADAVFLAEVLSDDRFFRASIVLITGENMMDIIPHTYFPHSNQALLAKYEDRDEISIWETYQYDIDSLSEVEKVGSWKSQRNFDIEDVYGDSTEGGLILNENDNIVRRQNLQGRSLRCVTLTYAPHTMFKKVDGKVEMRGWMVDIIDVIREICNFTYTCVEPEDGEWGVMRNNKWTGMVSEIMSGKADIVLAPLDHTPGRDAVVDFSIGVTEIGFHMAVRRPTQADVTWSSYVMELTGESWSVTVAYLILSWILLPLITQNAPGEPAPLSYSEAAMIMVGSLSSNGVMRPMKNVSSRIMLFTVYITSFLVLAHYTAFLTSSLAVTSLKLPFSNLQEMLQNDDYDFGIPAGSSIEEGLGKTKNPIYQELYNRFVKGREHELPQSFGAGVERVKEGKYVFLTGFLNFYSTYGDDCSMMLLKEGYMRAPTGYAFRKRSPLQRIVNYHMIKQRETGVMNKLWKRWEPINADCNDKSTKTSLGLWNVMTAYILLGFAMFSALIFLFGEILQNRSR